MVGETEIRQSHVLGSGSFGNVFKGFWNPQGKNSEIPVTIKVLQNVADPKSCVKFMEEVSAIFSVDHPNIVKLLAICTMKKIMLIFEFLPLGCSLDYMKKYKHRIEPKTFLHWFTQVARGMAFLEERSLVHGNLNTRNILIVNLENIKISDFGLSKLMAVESEIYQTTTPVNWLPLESIRKGIFTIKSDVWAFGVTLWELLTYGRKPFENVRAQDVAALIENGKRLAQPDNCSLKVFYILLSCWIVDREARPTFKELCDRFDLLSKDPERYLAFYGEKFLENTKGISDGFKVAFRKDSHNTSLVQMNENLYTQDELDMKVYDFLTPIDRDAYQLCQFY